MDTSKEILNNPFVNKGTAFSMAEREKLNLVGLLPPVVQTLEEQIERTYYGTAHRGVYADCL